MGASRWWRPLRGGWGAAVLVAAGGWGEGGLAADRVAAQPPAAFVDGAVVDAAQQHQVVEAGRPTREPMVQVVGVGPGWGRSQPTAAQPPSRTARARRSAGGTTRVARPRSSSWTGAASGGGSSAIVARSAPASPPPSAALLPTPLGGGVAGFGVVGVAVDDRAGDG